MGKGLFLVRGGVGISPFNPPNLNEAALKWGNLVRTEIVKGLATWAKIHGLIGGGSSSSFIIGIGIIIMGGTINVRFRNIMVTWK